MNLSKDIPAEFQNKFDGTDIDKGMYEGQLCMYAWTAIPVCAGRGCPAFIDCSFAGKNEVDEMRAAILEGETAIELPKCSVLKEYMMSISNIIFRNYGDVLTEPQLYRIGMHLFPLYRILGKLKLAELSDGPVMNIDDKGIRRMSPIFKEIREQIKLIEHTWDTIGLKLIEDSDLEDLAGIVGKGQYEVLHSAIQEDEEQYKRTNAGKSRIKRRKTTT